MSHDLEASYASAEVAAHFLKHPNECFETAPDAKHLSVFAAREGKNAWPHADGVIDISVTSGGSKKQFGIAVEFKRPNEGLHGVLTAIGQVHAYLRKGYAGAVIVVPESYAGLLDTGAYLKDVLDLTSKSEAIGVFGYKQPDMAKASPFAGCLTLHRKLFVDKNPPIAAPVPIARTETQWAHVREGSTDPDALFKYLQTLKLLSGGSIVAPSPAIPTKLVAAAKQLNPNQEPERYLSYAPGDQLHDRAWRWFWFRYVLHPAAIEGWTHDKSFAVNAAPSRITRSDQKGPKMFFAGRTDSIKNKLVDALNANKMSETDALLDLAKNYHDRAHSYREDIDSGAEHLGFTDNQGRLTDAGYRFVDACERNGNPHVGVPRAIFMSAVLREGALGAFLHYVYRLSEARFAGDPLEFTKKEGGELRFEQDKYLQWLEEQLADELHVMRKVSARGGVSRKPFQAEFALLRNLGIVGGFRVGVGLVVNWPEFQNALEYAAAREPWLN